jgi:hypothetical protein
LLLDYVRDLRKLTCLFTIFDGFQQGATEG